MIRAWIAWFVVLNLLWFLLISTWVLEEEILGLFASALAATAASAVSRQRLVSFSPRLRWILAARRLPRLSITETVAVMAALWRTLRWRGEVRGGFRTRVVSLPDDPAESQAKRALLIAGESFPPNTYVLGIDEDTGLMLIHELVPTSE